MIRILLLALSAFVFVACSGKVQTNKIPNTTKYYLPYTNEVKELKANSYVLQEFERELERLFKTHTPEEMKQSIYKTGLNRGHFQ